MASKTYPRVVQLLNDEIPGKISRNEFCRITGINRNSVDRYQGGVGTPILETLQKLSDYFGVTVEWLRGGNGQTPPRVALLLQEAVSDGRFEDQQQIETFKKFFGDPLKPATIDALLQHNAEPNEATLKKLSNFFMVSVGYLQSSLTRTPNTAENAEYWTKKGQAYLELLELVPDRLKRFVLDDFLYWQDNVAEFIDEEALTDSEENALKEVKDKADKFIERAENGEYSWYKLDE